MAMLMRVASVNGIKEKLPRSLFKSHCPSLSPRSIDVREIEHIIPTMTLASVI